MFGTRRLNVSAIVVHLLLAAYTLLALAPVLLIVSNSFKTRLGIFAAPLALPDAHTFSLIGYTTVLARGHFDWYFENSLLVTAISLVLVIGFGAMAAFALAEYRFFASHFAGVYFALGIMVPIRLGTVVLLRMMVASGLAGTLFSLILVYTAQGLPLAIYVLTEFMRTVSDDLKSSARIDGLSEYAILFRLVFPLIRPAIATISVFTLVPIWNDLWFPLILAPNETTKTVTLGAQTFIGQFLTNWNAVLAALTLVAIPVAVVYLLFSRQIVRGLTAGAIK
jgi:raffinose/stachyose/melibiose transport system permease protein